MHLIEDRHSFDNLVLLCGEHAGLIDDPAQGYTVAEIVEMKRVHEAKVARERGEARAAPRAAIEGNSRTAMVRTLILDDVASWERKAIKRLASEEPDDWAWLVEQLNDPPSGALAVMLISTWPTRLAGGSEALQTALARIAEGIGEMSAAATVWEHIAERHDAHARADNLTRAAIDAGVGGDTPRREQLLRAAEALDPRCPRLLVERMEDLDLTPDEQLGYLAEIGTDDHPLASLVAVHRARATMLLQDLERAAQHLQEAEELDADSLAVRSMAVNLSVQRARMALRDDRAFSLHEAESALTDALELREALLKMRRFDESVRLLMLAADVPSLSRDRGRAAAILERVRPEELATEDGPAVLGDAALRCGDAELAVRFAASGHDGAARRIAATARIDLNRDREKSLEELRGLALGRGPEAVQAALARLQACMPPVRADWDNDVAAVLDDGDNHRALESLRVLAFAAAGKLEEAERQVAELPNAAWTAELRLRVAGVRGNVTELRRAAAHFLAFGPDASGCLLAARGLAKAGELQQAAQVLSRITNDVNASPIVRADAYATHMRVLADLNDWDHADRIWHEWQAFTRTLGRIDGQLSAWQVRIAHRRRGQTRPAD